MCQHGGGQVTNEGKGLGMQVSKHRVQFPAADEADGIGIDLAAVIQFPPEMDENWLRYELLN